MGIKPAKWKDYLSFEFSKNKPDQKKQLKDKQALFKELEEAKLDWLNAGKKLDYVLEHDQIDYAIYALEAAERRYEMLLRKVKEMKFKAEHSETPVQFAADQSVGQVLDQ